MAILNKDTVEVKRLFNATASRVYDAITKGILFQTCGATPSSIKMDLREGGEWSLVFGKQNYPMHGKFLKIVKNEKLVFTWSDCGQVTITLKEKDGATQMHLLHEGITADKLTEIDWGWRDGVNDFSPHLGQNVVIEREFKHPIAKVWDLFAQPAFFARTGANLATGKMDFRIGGQYSFDVPEGCSGRGDDYVKGEFTDIVPNKRIAFTWHTMTEAGPSGETVVLIDFTPKGDGVTHVKLTHAGFPNEAVAKSHHHGWSDIFERM